MITLIFVAAVVFLIYSLLRSYPSKVTIVGGDDKKEAAESAVPPPPAKINLRASQFVQMVDEHSTVKSHFLSLLVESEEEEAQELNTEVLGHVLLWGPPGTGKTTMARIIDNSLEPVYGFKPNLVELTPMQLQDYGDVVNLVDQISGGTLIFIDEIHGLPKTPMEALYNMLEYGKMLEGRGRGTQLPPHTVIGATTEPGTLLEPFRERFPIDIELKPLEVIEVYELLNDFIGGVEFPSTFDEYKGQDEAKTLIWMHMCALNKPEQKLLNSIQLEIARRATGIPRIGKNITKHFMALSRALGRPVNNRDAEMAFQLLGIDENGLHRADRRVMSVLFKRDNKPMGLMSLAAAANISKSDLENMVEGRLVRLGYLERTPRGRALTPRAIKEYSYLT